MAEKSTVYNCDVLSFTDPQAKGVISRWMKNFQPTGINEVFSGDLVELLVTINNENYCIDENSEIRFDVFEVDFLLTGGMDDHVVCFISENSQFSSNSYNKQEKIVNFQTLQPDETYESAVNDFTTNNRDGFYDYILVFKSADTPPVHYILTWWKAERIKDVFGSEFRFTIEVKDLFKDETEQSLEVTEPVVFGSIGGFLIDDVGKPISGQTMKLCKRDGSGLVEMTTNASGAFNFQNITVGRYRISVDGCNISVISSTIDVGHLEGYLTNDEGSPLSGKSVRLYRSDGELYAEGCTAANGTWVFKDIPIGNYRISVKGYDISTASPSEEVGDIEGELISDKGIPLADQTVKLYGYDDGIDRAQVISDLSGRFNFQNCPVGKYRLAVDEHEIMKEEQTERTGVA